MSAEDALDEPLHVFLVGTSPIEAIAGGADTKIVVRLSRSWRQPVLDGFFGDRLQQSVASQASLNGAARWDRLNRLRTSDSCALGSVARKKYPQITSARFNRPWSRVSRMRSWAAEV